MLISRVADTKTKCLGGTPKEILGKFGPGTQNSSLSDFAVLALRALESSGSKHAMYCEYDSAPVEQLTCWVQEGVMCEAICISFMRDDTNGAMNVFAPDKAQKLDELYTYNLADPDSLASLI